MCRKLIVIFSSLILVMSSILISCTPGSNMAKSSNASSKIPQAPVDVVVEKASSIIDSKGGEVDLKNGAKLIVPAGALNGSANVVLTQLSNPKDCGTETTGYELTGLTGTTKLVQLVLSTKKGITSQEMEVSIYNPSNQNTSDALYQYNPASGNVTVTLDPAKLASLGSREVGGFRLSFRDIMASVLPFFTEEKVSYGIVDRIRVLFNPCEAYVPKASENIIRMPYYQQVGGGCWAADAMMLFRAYESADRRLLAGKVLYGVANGFMADVTPTDYGLNGWGMPALYSYVTSETGLKAAWERYYNASHLQWQIMRQIDNGHPLILRLLFEDEKRDHWLLIVGYRDYGNTIIFQDSKAMAKGPIDAGMYTTRPWSWIASRLGPLSPEHILWIDKPATGGYTLLTTECPGGDDTGGCGFGQLTFMQPELLHPGRFAPATVLQFTPSIYEGYFWRPSTSTITANNAISIIPAESSYLHLETAIWNADKSPANAYIEAGLYNRSTKIVSQSSQTYSLLAAAEDQTNVASVKIDLPVTDTMNANVEDKLWNLADASGNVPLNLDVALKNGSTVYDGFTVDFNLNILPRINSLVPAKANIADKVTINGMRFGAAKSSKGAVTIGGKDAKITSWSDTKIEFEVTANVPNGAQPVIVTVGDSNTFSTKPLILIVTQGSISLKPDTANVATGGTVQFTAQTSGIPDPSVNFTVDSGGGSITKDGIYRAPTTAGVYHVTATSVGDPSKTAQATVTVTAPTTQTTTKTTTTTSVPSSVWVLTNTTYDPPQGQPVNAKGTGQLGIDSTFQMSSMSATMGNTGNWAVGGDPALTWSNQFKASWTPPPPTLAVGQSFTLSGTVADAGSSSKLPAYFTFRQFGDLSISVSGPSGYNVASDKVTAGGNVLDSKSWTPSATASKTFTAPDGRGLLNSPALLVTFIFSTYETAPNRSFGSPGPYHGVVTYVYRIQ